MTVVQEQLEPNTEEQQFWNSRAHEDMGLSEDDLRVRPDDRHDRTKDWLPYLGVPAMVDRLLESVGDPRGKDVLDLGAGTGFLSVLMALHGANVTAIDVADEALSVTRHRAKLSGVKHRVRCLQMSAETPAFDDQSFDIVTGLFVLHHLDLHKAGAEIRRILRPGGRATFLETCGYNRLLMLCRDALTGRMGIPKASSPGESPIRREDTKVLERSFPSGVRVVFPELLFLRMLPAYVRVLWRRPIPFLVKAADRLLWKFGLLRSMSYYGLIEMTR